MFGIILSFSEFNDLYWPSLADGLPDKDPKTKNSFEHFSLRNVDSFLEFCLLGFLII